MEEKKERKEMIPLFLLIPFLLLLPLVTPLLPFKSNYLTTQLHYETKDTL